MQSVVCMFVCMYVYLYVCTLWLYVDCLYLIIYCDICVSVLPCLFPAGPLCPGPGAVPLQWCQHDRLQAPQHRQPQGSRCGGQVVHGASAGPSQA